MEWEDWFAMFTDKLRALGWTGPIDRGSAQIDFENETSPEEAAETLYKELTAET